AKRPLLPSFCIRLNILHEVKLLRYPQNTLCIPVVKIFACLELESRYSGKHFSKVSYYKTIIINILAIWIILWHEKSQYG
ncbi:MAG: hypothetical protein V3T59_00140, partial [Desulfobacterales bacterium]